MDRDTDGCVFCDIVAGRSPGFIVGQNELAMALLDINPLATGHCLVIPRRHVPWWHDMSREETRAVFDLAREISERIVAAFEPEFVAMYVRGRRIPHTHVFLVPTSKGDPLDRHFNALEGFQEAAEALASLRDPKHLDEVKRRLLSP